MMGELAALAVATAAAMATDRYWVRRSAASPAKQEPGDGAASGEQPGGETS